MPLAKKKTKALIPKSAIVSLLLISKSKKEKRAWVVITTKARVYEIQGNTTSTVAGGKGGGWAEEVFKPLREGAPSG